MRQRPRRHSRKMGRVTFSKLDPLDKLRYLAGKKMQDACEYLRNLSRARGGVQGSAVGKEDMLASLAHINVSPPAELIDAVWENFGLPTEKVSIWKVLSKLPAPRAGRSVELLLHKIAGVQKSIENTIDKKKYKQTAELKRTEDLFWEDLNTLRLGADGDDSAFKVKERELMKLVGSSMTSNMKKNSEAALNNFRDLMRIGHTPTPTPRGSRFLVVDYERPRTHENNMLIDLLAPDSHQNWRGTLRHNHLKMWKEKHDNMEDRYKAVMNKCQYQRSRAEALAFSKEPFPAQYVFEQEQQGKTQMAANTHRSAPELSRPNTSSSSSVESSAAFRPMSRAGTVVSDDVSAGLECNQPPPWSALSLFMLRPLSLALCQTRKRDDVVDVDVV